MFKTEEEFLDYVKPLAARLQAHCLKETDTEAQITDAKISFMYTFGRDYSVADASLSRATFGSGLDTHISLFSGDKTISFSQNGYDEDALMHGINQNKAVIHFAQDAPHMRLLEPEKVYSGEATDLDLSNSTLVSEQDLVSYALEMERTASDHPSIKTIKKTKVSQAQTYLYRLSTNGLETSFSKTTYGAAVTPIAENQGGMETGYKTSRARHFNDMKPANVVGKEASLKALGKLGSTLPKTQDMPIVLSPDASSFFFGQFFQAANGGAVHNEVSYMADKIGQQVMSEEITLIDDPTIQRGLRSNTLDSSGMKMDKVTFVENGILQTYNMTLSDSRKLGLDPIGRNDGVTNSYILPSSVSPEKLMADIQEGIYIRGFNGGTVDMNDGRHSRQAEGHYIRDGKITDEAVSGFVVSGDIRDMFMQVSIANDTPQPYGITQSMCAPTARINGVTIAGL